MTGKPGIHASLHLNRTDHDDVADTVKSMLLHEFLDLDRLRQQCLKEDLL